MQFVLVHRLDEEVRVRDVPGGMNWTPAINNPGFRGLAVGEAWYSAGGAPGKIKVRLV